MAILYETECRILFAVSVEGCSEKCSPSTKKLLRTENQYVHKIHKVMDAIIHFEHPRFPPFLLVFSD